MGRERATQPAGAAGVDGERVLDGRLGGDLGDVVEGLAGTIDRHGVVELARSGELVEGRVEEAERSVEPQLFRGRALRLQLEPPGGRLGGVERRDLDGRQVTGMRAGYDEPLVDLDVSVACEEEGRVQEQPTIECDRLHPDLVRVEELRLERLEGGRLLPG